MDTPLGREAQAPTLTTVPSFLPNNGSCSELPGPPNSLSHAENSPPPVHSRLPLLLIPQPGRPVTPSLTGPWLAEGGRRKAVPMLKPRDQGWSLPFSWMAPSPACSSPAFWCLPRQPGSSLPSSDTFSSTACPSLCQGKRREFCLQLQPSNQKDPPSLHNPQASASLAQRGV